MNLCRNSGGSAGDLRSLLPLSLFHFHRGNPGIHAPWLQIARGDQRESQNRALADVHARTDAGTRADPGAGPNLHGIGQQGKCRVIVIMGRPAEIRPLRQDGGAPEADRSGVLNLCAIARRDLIGTLQVPRRPYPRARIKMAVRAHLRAED